MENILLLNPPGKYQYLRDQYCSSAAKADYYWPPIDLLILSGILGRDKQRSDEFKLSVLDAIVEKKNPEQLKDFISRNSISTVCALTSTSSKEEDFQLFQNLKQTYDLKIVLNGGFLRQDPRKFLKEFDFIDAIITDYTQTGIVDYLKGKQGALSGLCYKTKGREIQQAAQDKFNQTFSYPVPLHELFPLQKYRAPQARFVPFTCALISSGCPYNCRFCSSASIPFRKRELDNIITELKAIKNLGVREVHFPDFTFTADKNHCLEVCQAMIKENLDLSWDCLSRTDAVDEEIVEIMKKAGCHTIQFGVETQNESVLKQIGKPISQKTIRNAFSLCQKQGIETIGFFIIGLPSEDEQSIKRTISFAKEVNCDYASFSVFVPDFGAAMRGEITEKYPEIKDLYSFDRTIPPVIGNDQISRERIWQLRNEAIHEFYFRPQYIYNRLRAFKSLNQVKTAARIFCSILKEKFKPKLKL